MWLWSRRGVRPESCGPKLAYHEAPKALDAPTRIGDAAWLALMTLPPVDRDRVIELLSSLLTLAEARSTPALYDWISKDVQEDFAPVQKWLLPVTDSAKAVIQERWVARDFEVRVLGDSQPVEDEQVVSTWSSVPPAEEPARIARSVAWALTGAVLVSGLSRDERDRAGAALRARIPVADSPIAVVLDAELQARRKAPAALSNLVRACADRRKLIRTVGGQIETRPLAALADATEEPLLPWLKLGDGELLVVPRQSAVEKPSAFRRDVAAALEAAAADGRLVCAPRT